MIDKMKTILFTVAVTAVFALIVSGINAALSGKIIANKTIARQIVILKLFNLASETAKLETEEIPEFFAKKVIPHSSFKEAKTEGFKIKDAENDLIVCSFSGQGFWDLIKGYIALDLEEKKIAGIEFTQQGETPGLGGRIVEPEFKKRFIGKPFTKVRSDGLRLKFVPEGTAQKADEIDGITGATGTTTALEKIINNSIDQILKITEGRAAN